MTSLLEWGKLQNITFHIGGWTDQCGEDTLNRDAALLPTHTYSRLLTKNVTTFSDAYSVMAAGYELVEVA